MFMTERKTNPEGGYFVVLWDFNVRFYVMIQFCIKEVSTWYNRNGDL